MTSAPASATPTRGPLRRALAGVRWYAKQLSGESKWDEHLARCERDGVAPMTRRDFERHRDHQREHGTQARCC